MKALLFSGLLLITAIATAKPAYAWSGDDWRRDGWREPARHYDRSYDRDWDRDGDRHEWRHHSGHGYFNWFWRAPVSYPQVYAPPVIYRPVPSYPQPYVVYPPQYPAGPCD